MRKGHLRSVSTGRDDSEPVVMKCLRANGPDAEISFIPEHIPIILSLLTTTILTGKSANVLISGEHGEESTVDVIDCGTAMQFRNQINAWQKDNL